MDGPTGAGRTDGGVTSPSVERPGPAETGCLAIPLASKSSEEIPKRSTALSSCVTPRREAEIPACFDQLH